MQLDKTHVVIRLRSLAEIGDLALVMIRRYPAALLTGFVLGALPWAVANALLLDWIPIQEAAYGLDDEEASAEVSRYTAWMALLVMLQTPSAGVLTTYYLGQAVFEHQPTWSKTIREIHRQCYRWIMRLSVQRLALPAMGLVAFRFGSPASWWWDFWVPVFIFFSAAIIRATRPFLPEILLLENCPLRSRSPDVITASRRNRALHAPISSDLFSRFVAVSLIHLFLFLSVMYSLIWVRGLALGQWNWDLLTLVVLYPLALWVVAGFSVIVRLLSYLDTRIRLEGWEVELAVRAEAMRQFGETEHEPPSSEASGASGPSAEPASGRAAVVTGAGSGQSGGVQAAFNQEPAE
jgi:hypothetical protein